jgi:E3 ubiquitin-protein ligase DOA10
MLNKLLQGPLYLGLLIKDILTFILDREFTSTLVIIGLASVLLYFLTGELVAVYLSVVFLTMFLILGMGYLLIMMKTYGLLVEVEASVDFGVMFAAMVWILLTGVAVLGLSPLCMS